MPLPSSQTAIHSFYQREVQVDQPIPREEFRRPGDGFTEAELADALDPLNRWWNPERSYRRYTIDQLAPGPQAVTFEGRIVNLNTRFGRSPKQPKATGWHYFIVKDDTAAISVKLYFAQTPYPLKLGLLVTCWTGFISGIVKPATTPVNNTMSISANMFPGRATADHVLIHHSTSTNSICHTPLDYHPGEQLSGLMTLGSYLSGGHDGVEGAKILVIVKSIGATRIIKRADGGEGKLVDVMLMDHTNEIRMTIWDGLIPSVRNWVAGETVLLVSSPGYKPPHSGVGKGSVAVLLHTMIDVNPEFRDAEWLKRWAEGKVRNEAFQVGILEDEWDIEAAEYGVVRNFFALSELDAWTRSDGNQSFTGFINVIIMTVELTKLQGRNMLMCGQCCGIPAYSNDLELPCRSCKQTIPLSPNPRIVGQLLDETGCLAGGQLLWSRRAWELLLGQSVEGLIRMTPNELEILEMRILGLRCHFCVGWKGIDCGDDNVALGKLAVLGVKM